jgi:hypothetical protein
MPTKCRLYRLWEGHKSHSFHFTERHFIKSRSWIKLPSEMDIQWWSNISHIREGNIITAEYGDQNVIHEIKKQCKRECLVCFGMFRSFGALFLCGTNSDGYDLPAHATAVSLTQLEDQQMWCSSKTVHLHSRIIMFKNFLTCIFLGTGFCTMDQFHRPCVHPILCHLISSCGDTLRTLFTTPVTSLNELKLRIVTAIKTVALQMLKNTWQETGYYLDILHATKGMHDVV